MQNYGFFFAVQVFFLKAWFVVKHIRIIDMGFLWGFNEVYCQWQLY